MSEHQPGMRSQHGNVVSYGAGVGRAGANVDHGNAVIVGLHQMKGWHLRHALRDRTGLTSTQALERLGEEAGRDFMLCAIAAMHYFKEKMEEPDTRTLQ